MVAPQTTTTTKTMRARGRPKGSKNKPKGKTKSLYKAIEVSLGEEAWDVLLYRLKQLFYNAEAHRAPLEDDWTSCTELYYGEWTPPDYIRNKVHVPRLEEMIDTTMAKTCIPIFTMNPLSTIRPLNPTYRDAADAHNAKARFDIESPRSIPKMEQAAFDTNLFGTSITQCGWDFFEKRFGFRTLYLTDFWPSPYATSIQSASFLFHRFVVPARKAWQLAEMGIWEKEQLEKLSISAHTEEAERIAEDRGGDVTHDVGTSSGLVWDGNLVCMAFYGWIPLEDTRDEPRKYERVRIISAAVEGGAWTILSLHRIDPTERLPFIRNCQKWRRGRFWGTSFALTLKTLQEEINKYRSSRLDIVDVLRDPMYMVLRQAGIDPAMLAPRPGGLVFTSRMGGIEALPFAGAPQLLESMEQYTNSDIERAVGAFEPLRGQPSSKRMTKYEIASLIEHGSTRFQLAMVHLAYSYIAPLFAFAIAFNSKHLSVPELVTITGDDGFFIEKEIKPEQLQGIDPDALMISVNSQYLAMSPEEKRQELAFSLQVLAGDPDFATYPLKMELLRGMGYIDIDEVVRRPSETAKNDDPAKENQLLMMGVDVPVYEYQDHEMHIMSHMGVAQAYMLAGNISPVIYEVVMRHNAQHEQQMKAAETQQNRAQMMQAQQPGNTQSEMTATQRQ